MKLNRILENHLWMIFLFGSAEYVSSGDLLQQETKYIISEKGKLIADRIAAYLFR
ncbi:MAG: hypothetical protein IPI23_17585 [Bacteroidetes bacterium]|nr:hypothetical protein [Bacteroidota bacterium]